MLLKQREAETMEKSLDAQVKKKAEAEKFERQQKAEAELFERQKEAEAKKFETEKAAEAQRAKAEADLFSKEQEGQRYPHGRRSRSQKRFAPKVLRRRKRWKNVRRLIRNTTTRQWRKC